MKYLHFSPAIVARWAIPTLTGLLLTAVLAPNAQAAAQSYSWYTNQVDKVIWVAPGGTGNGSSDTNALGSLREAVQQAVSASNEATPKDVKIILKSGTYNINSSANFSGANLTTTLMIEGVAAGGVILDGAGWTTSDDPALTVHAYKRNVVLRNLIFKNFRKSAAVFRNGYSGSASTAIADHDNWLVENCEWNNNGTALVQDSNVNNRSAGANFMHMQNFTMRNCKFLNNGGPGLEFMGRDALLEDLTVTGNFTRGLGTNTANGGINFVGLNTTINRCKFNNNVKSGLRMDHVAENVTITNSEFNNNGADGMFWETAYGPVNVRDTAINGNARVGVGLATAYDFNFERCNIQNNVVTQIEILPKSRPVNPDGCAIDPNLCALGAGNLNQPAGSQWANLKSMEWVLRTKIWECTITTDVNTNGLITKQLNNGVGSEYRDWVRTELNADYNRYYSTKSTNVFDIGPLYNQYQLVAFAAWKTEQNIDTAQGDDEHSVWGDPATTVGTGTGLKGQYYSGTAFNTLVKPQTDSTINFSWGYGSPTNTNGTTMSSIGPDNFSVRWTGKVQAMATGSYTFTTTTDDGVRLWVNNVLLIDKWINQSATSWSGTIALNAGQKYDIKMEYYDAANNAQAKLFWTRPGNTSVIIPQTQLYPAP